MNDLVWPPVYTVRRSARARYIRLAIDPAKGLQMVLPKTASEQDGLRFLHDKRAWIERHASLLSQESQARESARYQLPDSLDLNALGRTVKVDYHHSNTRLQLHASQGQITLAGKVTSFKSAVPLVKRWLIHQAKPPLLYWLKELSELTGLAYNRGAVRAQKSLWGSCTPEKNINLNAKLVFFPYEVVRYVIIHELCHTVEMNHSKRFWSLVGQFEPCYKRKEYILKNPEEYLPLWCME